MAGYSGAPLIKKLGIKAGMKISFVNAPEEFWKELAELPDVKVSAKPGWFFRSGTAAAHLCATTGGTA